MAPTMMLRRAMVLRTGSASNGVTQGAGFWARHSTRARWFGANSTGGSSCMGGNRLPQCLPSTTNLQRSHLQQTTVRSSQERPVHHKQLQSNCQSRWRPW